MNTTMISRLFAVAMMLFTADSLAQSCGTLDWSTESWPSGSLSNSFTVAGQDVDINISDPSDASPMAPAEVPVDLPANVVFYQGTTTLVVAAQLIRLGTTNSIDMEISLGDAGVGVQGLNFMLFDVDGQDAGDTRQELVEISGSLGAASVSPMLTTTSNHQVSGSTVMGMSPTPETGAGATDGNVAVSFPSPVDTVTIRFSIATTFATTNPNTQPGYGLTNVSFCTVANSSALPVPAFPGLTLLLTGISLFLVSLLRLR